jgi:hypothetical protein
MKLHYNLISNNLCDFYCGSGFGSAESFDPEFFSPVLTTEGLDAGQPRSCDNGNSAPFYRGWKPLPRGVDVRLMTLTPDFMKFHTIQLPRASVLTPETFLKLE